MALTDDQLGCIESLLGSACADSALGEFRQRFPGLSVTRCDLSDLGGEPAFRQYEQFHLFLVDRSDHCWRLTADPSRATGIVLARKAGV